MLYRTQFPRGLFAELDRLQREMQAFDSFPTIRGRSWGGYPAMNVGHTPGSVEIYVFAPGLDHKEIGLHLEKGVLIVEGQRQTGQPQPAEDNAIAHIAERFSGKFRRVVSLPEDIDPDRIEARYSDGVLHVSIPRREAAKPRQITIQ